ncbi:MAG: nitrite reductase large subunit, partial [Bauldia sp.]|nr:nitrite reductase large subunit [Bauldia sp.]
ATEDAALEMIVAVVELYREQGWYLERIYKWMARVGLDTVRRQVVEDAKNRAALFARFVFAQRFSQRDPWEERTRGVDAHEFRPMADLAYAGAVA